MKILVTGGSGFVGKALLTRLAEESDRHQLSATVRSPASTLPYGVTPVHVPDFATSFGCEPALRSVDAVVHLAARVHVMGESAGALESFRKVNVDGTVAIAKQAAAAGVRRFVFLSSIKVNGERTAIGRPFAAAQAVQPRDAYGRSKWEAELALQEIATASGMEIVIIRPPLVYGPGVKANFLAMMQWLHREVPLPLGAVTENRRSLVAVRNLSDLIATCIRHPSAGGQTLLVSDDEDLSTAELLLRLGRTLRKSPRLIAVPVPLLRLAATLAGRRAVADRLLGSLQVDMAPTRALLEWRPPFGVDQELEATARHFLSSLSR